MKYFIALIGLCISLSLSGQGIDFFEGTWEEALEEATRQKKVIFVDAYATWCGPCKRMTRSVFTHPEVGELFNQRFINVKLDMEKGEGLKFRRKYPVSAFPTLFFIDYSGKEIRKTVGAMDIDGFLRLGQSVLKSIDRSGEFAKAYEAGDRSPELILQYVSALNEAGKPSLKISNDYIKTQKDLTTDFNLKFILAAVTESDSRIFDLLIKNRGKITALSSSEAVNKKIEIACSATAAKAIEYGSADLLETTKGQMKKHYPQKAAAFSASVDLDYCKNHGDCQDYLKASKRFVKVNNSPKELRKVALEINKLYHSDAKAMDTAEKYAKMAALNGDTYEYYFTYANILHKNGKKAEALNAAQKSLSIAKEAKQNTRRIQTLIKKIEG